MLAKSVRGVFRRATAGSGNAKRSIMPSVGSQRFMSGLDEKERGEEATYFAKVDAKAKADMKAAMEKILSDEAHGETKDQIMEVLEKAEKPDTAAAMGLSDWKFALPVGLILAIPALGHEVIVLNEETQLVACFILFCSTMYTQVGGMVSSSLDDVTKEYKKQMEAVDDNMLVGMKQRIADNEKLLDLEADVKSMHSLVDDMTVSQVDVLNYAEKHAVRAKLVSKLDNLVALESAATGAIRDRVLTSVKADVMDTFATDKKAKDAALDQAMKVLAGGEGTAMGNDVVGKAFSTAIGKYKDEYAKMKPGTDPILVQLEKDIAAVVSAPEVMATGGNVYETHPIKA